MIEDLSSKNCNRRGLKDGEYDGSGARAAQVVLLQSLLLAPLLIVSKGARLTYAVMIPRRGESMNDSRNRTAKEIADSVPYFIFLFSG